MKSFLLIFLSYHITLSISILIKIAGHKTEYCYEKHLPKNEILTFNYVVSSSRPEKIIVSLINNANNKILYESTIKQSDNFKSDKLKNGNYTLCFHPLETGDESFYISFNYYSESETGFVLNLAQDTSLKKTNRELYQLSTAFLEFETNLRYLVDRRMTHYVILMNIIDTLKNLSYGKIAMIAVLSLLQVIIIRKFFGNDKRKLKVEGADKYGL